MVLRIWVNNKARIYSVEGPKHHGNKRCKREHYTSKYVVCEARGFVFPVAVEKKSPVCNVVQDLNHSIPVSEVFPVPSEVGVISGDHRVEESVHNHVEVVPTHDLVEGILVCHCLCV